MTPDSFADPREALRRVAPLRSLDHAEIDTVHDVMRALHVAAGTEIVRHGAVDRAMYVILDGRVRVERDGVELGRLDAGESFGEIALVVGEPRNASVVAETETSLLVLDEAAFDALVGKAPKLAISLLRRIVATTSGRLAKMNEAVGTLLAERALPRRVEVDVELGGRSHRCRNGTRFDALLPREVDGALVVAALVDGRARPLDAVVSGGCRLEPLTTAHWEGQRIYRESLGLVLLEAGQEHGLDLELGASLGFAQRVVVRNRQPDAALAAALQASIDRLQAEDRPLLRERLTPLEAVEHFRRQGWEETVRLLQTTPRRTVPLVSYGACYVPTTGPLLPSTGWLRRCAVEVDGDGLLLMYAVPGGRRALPSGVAASDARKLAEGEPVPELARHARDVSRRVGGMTATQERWLGILGVRSVGDFNHGAINGEVGELIRVAEGFHEKRISQIADAIAARSGELRVVAIAGPSSSGKTTFIRRLRVQLQVAGLRPIGLGLDDYYVDREATPRGADGDFDFESLHALRLDLLQDHLGRLAAGEAVQTARYDFPTGTSAPAGGPLLQLGPSDLLLVEGIHGLNPELARHLPQESMFRVFVCPMIGLPRDRHSRVHASDVRLLRRIVRDRHGRALDAAETIRRWPSVRDGERRHIFPYQHYADAVFDTGLVYEPSVLKVFAERYLLEVPPDDPAQATAERLLELLGEWVTIYPEHVPPTSLLREFIGGSGFGA